MRPRHLRPKLLRLEKPLNTSFSAAAEITSLAAPLLLSAALLCQSCASDSNPSAAAQSSPSSSAQTRKSAASPGPSQIRVGMTRNQVMQIWGEPSGRQVTAREEIWVYGNQHMLRMIPYAGPFLNVNTSKVIFRNGRVADFRNTDSGSVWSQAEGMGGSRFSEW